MEIQKEEITTNENKNIELRDSIKEYLDPFRDSLIKPDHYEVWVNALINYFETGSFPSLIFEIAFKKVNKKKIGWALKEIYKIERYTMKLPKVLPIEYCLFAKKYLSPFQDDEVDEVNFTSCNLYKSFTSRP